MNSRVVIIVVLIFLLGVGIFFFVNSQQNAQIGGMMMRDKSNPTSAGEAKKNFTSSDGRVQFSYPANWYLADTTAPEGGRGEFGVIRQSWVVSSYAPDTAGQGGIPDSGVKIDFEIQSGGGNLPIEKLVDCSMKTTSCEKIGIDSEQFIQSTATLNTGMKNIVIGTFYDDKILRASALIQTGAMQDAYAKRVEDIYQSIKFLP